MPSYFDDQAAMLRRLCDQMNDPDRNATAEHLSELERENREYRKADLDEDVERWDGQS